MAIRHAAWVRLKKFASFWSLSEVCFNGDDKISMHASFLSELVMNHFMYESYISKSLILNMIHDDEDKDKIEMHGKNSIL